VQATRARQSGTGLGANERERVGSGAGRPDLVSQTLIRVSHLPDPVDLTKRLCAIPSVTGSEAEASAFLQTVLEDLGFAVERQHLTETRYNLLARTDERPEVVLSTHLDTVPPHLDVWEDDAHLYGRGVCDAKGIAAAQVAALARLLASGERRIGALYTVDEEAASAGARLANAHPMGRDVRFLINGEPTDGLLASGTKGSLRLRLVAEGKAAHSAYPEAGTSAIETLLDVLDDLRHTEWPTSEVFGETTVNVGTIAGGVAANVLAPSAEAVLQIRLVTPPEAIETQVERVVDGRLRVERLSASDPIRLHVPDGWAAKAVRYTTDVPYLHRWGTPLLFGPGSILVAHTDGERIAKADLYAAADTYERLVRELLA